MSNMIEKNESFEEEAEVIMIDGLEHIHCPVCGELVIMYDICSKCGWENTGETNIDGGPNPITLPEARKQYEKTGKKVNHKPKSVKVLGYDSEFGIPITEIEY